MKKNMQYAVVTGATQGIGKAIAERLLKEGFSVAICARSEQDLTVLQNEWSAQYPAAKVLCIAADFTKQEDVTMFSAKVTEAFPQVDILINNAGIFIPGLLAEEPEGLLETLMQVNLYSAYHLTRALLPDMKAKRTGHIFNMCSVASLKSYPNGGSYSITKYALLGFSENLREELKNDNIKVTSICPGATNSRSWEGSGIPADRIMSSEDVANMLWATYTLSAQADVELLVMRPVKGDL
ncbi:SDR family NAD(P)-dependent oxidoreductase [Taibaiella soli]|uniref:Short-chain dehydrogenase n=1 Tax=Taibaiella soli TaxID=1649169 RepID=A0A2W2A7Q9_9BACT|nr:SDR family oxidoreductase [Taibaiella soli]PZF71385.1 short-chain dehydrogenase [Taibaiella soli]